MCGGVEVWQAAMGGGWIGWWSAGVLMGVTSDEVVTGDELWGNA